MRLIFQFFAKARELANAENKEINVCETTQLSDALTQLSIEVPALDVQFLKRCRIAHNKKYVPLTTAVEHDNTYVVIPPISGG